MSKIKNGGLDQYGARPFEQQQFGTAGVERVNYHVSLCMYACAFQNNSDVVVSNETTQVSSRYTRLSNIVQQL